jgi:hypothetical protein
MRHELKTHPPMYERLVAGEKTFEIRRDDGRGFQAGDTLVLLEFNPAGTHDCNDTDCNQRRYTGRGMVRKVGFVAKGDVFGLQLGPYAIMSLLPEDAGAEDSS